jgi:hypothetical protein
MRPSAVSIAGWADSAPGGGGNFAYQIILRMLNNKPVRNASYNPAVALSSMIIYV